MPVTEWLIFALMAAYFGIHTLPAAWKTLNTDFSNYYLTARLAREDSSTSRIYEWVWLQRQKDHREIDQRIISLVPITPFSTLAVWPFAAMPPLSAKHCWLILAVNMSPYSNGHCYPAAIANSAFLETYRAGGSFERAAQ